MNALPQITGIRLVLDETGEFPELTVWYSRPMTKPEISECHRIAGDTGAGIEFKRGAP